MLFGSTVIEKPFSMGNFSSISTRVNDSQIRNEVKEYPVVIYTKSSCSYCTKAKALLSEEKIEYEEKDLDAFYSRFPELYQEYVNGLVYVTRQTSVPQVFICGDFIGGFTELNALRVAGRLKDAIDECRDAFEFAKNKAK
uniref:Glutaredoxin-2 n=1 Tax=Ascaris suum TaxID=6253 RepID=F1LAH6_ASCSU